MNFLNVIEKMLNNEIACQDDLVSVRIQMFPSGISLHICSIAINSILRLDDGKDGIRCIFNIDTGVRVAILRVQRDICIEMQYFVFITSILLCLGTSGFSCLGNWPGNIAQRNCYKIDIFAKSSLPFSLQIP